MRPPKSRGKRIDNGEWVYGYYLQHGKYTYIITGIPNIPGMGTLAFIGEGCIVPVHPDTVSELIAIHPKTKQEVYAGDILLSHYKSLEADDTEVVLWNEDLFEYARYRHADGTGGPFCFDGDQLEISEVIGNITDTPELLKVNE